MMSVLKSLAAVLILVADLVNRYRRQKRKQDAQKSADRINVDPGSEWVRRFKRGQADATGGSDSRKSGGSS